MRNLFLILLLTGCYTREIEGIGKVGWRTEQYTLWHNVPAKANPQTPIEWQAKANEECKQILLDARLPDGNLAWKHHSGMTGCLFSFITNECICSGPPPIMQHEESWPRLARWYITGKWAHQIFFYW